MARRQGRKAEQRSGNAKRRRVELQLQGAESGNKLCLRPELQASVACDTRRGGSDNSLDTGLGLQLTVPLVDPKGNIAVTLNTNLKPGGIYFLVAYLDRSLRVPHISTYASVGQDGDAWYFQDAESFVKDGLLDISAAVGHPDCLCLTAEGAADLLDWDGLVAELAENKSMQDQGRSFAERAC